MEANLGPDQPRWRPESEADIRSAIDAGLITESHYIDMKREVGDTPNKRKETAKDLSSFGLDGDALLIGVTEDKAGGEFTLAPQPLAGVIERIDQIAEMAIDPSLPVVSVSIPSDADPTVGYLLVHVPPSPRAPHMVDGRYYARAERTRRIMPDAEVVRLHAQRESLEERAGRLLDAEIAREPVPAVARRLGHLYLIAQPLAAPSALARPLVRGPDQPIRELIMNPQLALSNQEIIGWEPTPHNRAEVRSNRSQGIAYSSHSLSGPGRTLILYDGKPAPDDGGILDIELHDDGGIRILVGRMTVELPSRYTGEHTPAIMDGLAVAYARRLIHWAVMIGDLTGWHGTWLLGLHGDHLRGRGSNLYYEGFGAARAPTFDVDTYREVTTASHLEMAQKPGVVADRLIGRLVDTLGTRSRFKDDLSDEPTGPS